MDNLGNKTAEVSFLRSKQLLAENRTQFVIRRNDGTEMVELTELLSEYALLKSERLQEENTLLRQQLSALSKVPSDEEFEILFDKLLTERGQQFDSTLNPFKMFLMGYKASLSQSGGMDAEGSRANETKTTLSNGIVIKENKALVELGKKASRDGALKFYVPKKSTPPQENTTPDTPKDEGWIRVEDRLPEDAKRVLIYSSSGISIGVYDVSCQYLKKPGFYDCEAWSDVYGFDEDKSVTKWMPLPSPPSINDNNQQP